MKPETWGRERGEPAWYRDATASDVAARIDTHEAVCAERWGQILKRMSRMETVIYSAAAALLTGMAGMIWALFQKVAHL